MGDRSDWGLDSPRETRWESRGCRRHPEWWVLGGRRQTWLLEENQAAVLICLGSCPVLDLCERSLAGHPRPVGVVQAGRAFGVKRIDEVCP